MLDVLLSVRVFGTIGKGAIGEKGLVTVTATVLPGALSGVHVASTSTVVPTVLFWTVPWPNIPGVDGLAPGAKHLTHEIGQKSHSILAYGLYLLFVLHVIGALKH